MLRRASTLLAGLIGAGSAFTAGPVPDPTRPPSPVAVSAAPAARAAPRAAPAPDKPRLTSILLDRRGVSTAWVDGQLVREGESLASGERLSRIDAQGVTLSTPRGEQRLWLLADVMAPTPRRATPPSTPQPASVDVAGSKAP